MVKDADVLTENYRRGTLEKLGLGYDVLSKVNPGLIYCAVSGYGRDGPYGDKGGFDLIAQGFSGLMSVTGEPGRPPAKTGNSIADINAGILAVAGITAAYVHKLKTGEGQVVDTSLMEAAIQQTYWQAAIYFATGESSGPTGSAHLLTAPYQAFRASDGWLNIGGANQANWERIADTLGHPEWRDDPRFASNSARMENLDALVAAMNAVLVDAHQRRVDRRRSTPPACRSGRCTRSGKRCRIRKRWRATWWSTWCIRRPGRPRRSAARSIFRRRRPASTGRRRCWASIRANCCANTITATPKSMDSWPPG